jgi:hypothetical protein
MTIASALGAFMWGAIAGIVWLFVCTAGTVLQGPCR